jgi:hypothetical protein
MLQRYLTNEIERPYIQKSWALGKPGSLPHQILSTDPAGFSIRYRRQTNNRSITPAIERDIVKELTIEKRLIQNKDVPIRSYNYSYIKTRLENDYGQKISLPTIIDRAKKHGFYLRKPSVHDREVLTTTPANSSSTTPRCTCGPRSPRKNGG